VSGSTRASKTGSKRQSTGISNGLRAFAPALCASLLGTAVIPFPALADEAPDNTPNDTIVTLDDLVVTSTGFGESRMTHPGNISKINDSDIDFTKSEQPSELLNRVPGLGIEQGSGVEHLTAIRSPVLTGGAGAGSFLYLEDGVPLRAAGFGNVNGLMEMMTEESGGIEVVRGPGSVLYGSNAEHGLINVLSRAPSQSPQGSLTGWAGPHGTYNLDGTASTSFQGENNTTQGVRGSFAINEDGGFRDESGYGQQKGQLRYDFTSTDTRVRATVTTINLNQETAGYITGLDSYKDPAIYKTNPNPDAYRDAWAFRSAIRFERDISSDETIALTPYMRTNSMEFLMHFLPGTPVEKSGHWSGGLLTSYEKRLQGGHKLIFGFDAEYTDGNLSETQSGPTVAGWVTGTHYDYDVTTIVLAPYLHTAWQLAPATTLSAGVRYEYARYDYTNNAGPTSGLVYIADRAARPDDRIDTFSNPTPKLGLVHIFSDELTGFVNLARAARAPQTTDLYRLQKIPGTAIAINPDSIKSEVLDSIEIGTRGQIGNARYEIATYFMKKRNFSFRDASGNTINNGKTQHVGIEAELTTPLAWGFDLAASATYAQHTYEFDNAAEGIVSGNDVDTAPRTIANVRLGYGFIDDRARLELEWVHRGAYETDAANLHDYGGHDLLNLRGEFAVTENLSVFGRVSNLLDTRYADRADFTTFSGDRYFPGEDRGVYAGATVRF
jgi:outer membrane receptor protein involved in Fe transport